MKKLGIMQPYFFPYIGYFSLIKHTDEFILFDTAQFIRHGWIERNRVLKQTGGWLYIQAPLQKHSRDTVIRDIRLDNATDWQGKLLSQLQPYKRIAPYYRDVMPVISAVLEGGHQDIVSLNRAALEAVCTYLGISRQIEVFSGMNLAVEPATSPDEWALNICKALGGVDEYWNPPGGQGFFDRTKYHQAGIGLVFQTPQIVPYDQKRQPFEPGLSIIDVMMFNDPTTINHMLDQYDLT